DLIGTIEVGKLADLLAVDGNPLDHPDYLTEPERIRLVLQAGTPVAGTMLEQRLG
ncbi:MAG: Amidohydrolase family, partial [Chloroflexota bacterium]